MNQSNSLETQIPTHYNLGYERTPLLVAASADGGLGEVTFIQQLRILQAYSSDAIEEALQLGHYDAVTSQVLPYILHLISVLEKHNQSDKSLELFQKEVDTVISFWMLNFFQHETVWQESSDAAKAQLEKKRQALKKLGQSLDKVQQRLLQVRYKNFKGFAPVKALFEIPSYQAPTASL